MRRAFLLPAIAAIACGPFFYQAPPPLNQYPERVATKQWTDFADEAAPADPQAPEGPALDLECRGLPAKLAPLPPAERLAEIDRLLATNRGGPYSSRRANFLHELRELAAEDPLFGDAASYIGWRMDHGALLPKRPPVARPWDMEQAEFDRQKALYQEQLVERLAEIEKLTGEAPASLRPYWLVRKGAFLFGVGKRDNAASVFQSVLDGFPDHPRAEVAALMLGRSRIEQACAVSRDPEVPVDEKPDRVNELRGEARTILSKSLERYPKGRFSPDAEGWLGALAFDEGRYGETVRRQIRRMKLQPTREILRSGLRECDMVFGLLLGREEGADGVWIDADENFDAAAIAGDPWVTRLFLSRCIDPTTGISLPVWWDDGYSGDRETIDFLRQRILRPQPFVRASLAELGSALLSSRGKPDRTTLVLLAWSATADGEHEQALALLDRVPADDANDESMHARAVVLQRLERHREAAGAFDDLERAFPNSPLCADVAFRRSLCHFHAGDSARAILDVLPHALPPERYGDPSTPSRAMRPDTEWAQWLDLLVQFSPLEDLQAALAKCDGNPPAETLLRHALRTRAIAAERFDLAAAALDATTEDPPEDLWPIPPLMDDQTMDRERWDACAEELARRTAALAGLDGSARAQEHLQIARLWMKQRGRLSLPSISLCYYAGSEEEKQDLLRRRNALAFGIDRERIHRELDSRDEATHALEHALEAAKSDNPAIAAPALELANQCLFRRAEFSLYQRSRAIERDDGATSKHIYQELRSRFPASAEAKRAAFFAFPPVAGRWMPGDYNPQNSAGHALEAIAGPVADEAADPDAEIGRITNAAIAFDGKAPLAQVRRSLREAHETINKLRAGTDPENQSGVLRIIDRLDDLEAAASLPGIATVDLRRYADGRFRDLPPGFAAFVEFRGRLAPLLDEQGFETGRRNDTIEGWREFLEKHQDSPKAEAASLRLTRLIARQHRGRILITACHFPEAPIPNGYKHVSVARDIPDGDPDEVLAAIDAHERRFPGGRYQADLNLLRAGALIDAREFSRALPLIEGILANPRQQDLRVVALLNFMDIAQRLLVPEERLEAAKAFRRSTASMKRLRKLVRGDTFLWRLGPLMPWLENRG
ncbi:MAG: hypothetical protein H7A48_02090 [Akkermansiaceae bacterium]|nr:hypothetical protein [Akkermansiaceae bacterium]